MSENEALTLPEPGDILDGKYRIVRLIGEGGMGAVYVAHHEMLQHEVAIKLLLPEVAKDKEAVARFLSEARAVARLRSPHVAAVLDIGTLANGSAYMALEYLDGQDLGAILAERGPLPVAEAVDYVLQALEGVAHAHAIGIVHRDIKPANIFVTKRYDGAAVVKVLDFGIAKATNLFSKEASSGVTVTKAMLGSPSYMSPEQVRSSKHVDARTDLWAMGVTLYRLLTDAPPFVGENLGAIFAAILEDEPAPPSRLRPEMPPELELVIMRCLERKPDLRWQTAADLARALAPFTHGAGAMSAERIYQTLSLIPPPPLVKIVPAPGAFRVPSLVSEEPRLSIAQPDMQGADAFNKTMLSPAATEAHDSAAHKLRSGSIAAWAEPSRLDARVPRPSRGVHAWVFAAIAVLAIGGTAIVMSRGPAPTAAGAPQPTTSVPVASPASAPPSAEVVTTVASAAPSAAVAAVSASASASAATATPSIAAMPATPAIAVPAPKPTPVAPAAATDEPSEIPRTRR